MMHPILQEFKKKKSCSIGLANIKCLKNKIQTKIFCETKYRHPGLTSHKLKSPPANSTLHI